MHGFRAILLCEEATLDVENGTLSLSRIYSNRLLAPVPAGPIVVDRFVVVAIATDLQGADFVGVRHRLRAVGHDVDWPVLAYHAHDPKRSEHNFAFGHERLEFDDGGAFELELEIHANGEIATGRLAFTVERSPL